MPNPINALFGFVMCYMALALPIALVIAAIYLISRGASKPKGYWGERQVIKQLEKLDPEKYFILNDLLIPTDEGYTQIDHVVISNQGIFVIETKYFEGWIFADPYRDYWTQSFRRAKFQFRNPIHQNYGHIQGLKKHISSLDDSYFSSRIAFMGGAEFKNEKPAEIVDRRTLLNSLTAQVARPLTLEEKKAIRDQLLAVNVESEEIRQEHIARVSTLINDRKEKVANRECPKCGGKLVEREGKYGSFTGCSGYPYCKYTLNSRKY